MVADDLALSITQATVRPGLRVLDPFCGSGRILMAAAAIGAYTDGYDVNPLACLITKAKASNICPITISGIAREALVAARLAPGAEPITLRGVRVKWFSPAVEVELSQIVDWISNLGLTNPETLVVGVALSAAIRDAAWIRKSGWKLHRMDEETRIRHTASAWVAFSRRLKHYAARACENPLSGSVHVTLGPLRNSVVKTAAYDVVITSPPYGDSRTTVQYGAVSGISLDVITRIPGLELYYKTGRQIDADCLGSPTPGGNLPALKNFWAGAEASEGARRVSRFLGDFARTCNLIAELLTPDGVAIMVLGRRSVGGFRVKIDDFASAVMEERGIKTTTVQRRRFASKKLPDVINRFARSEKLGQFCRGRIKTMDEEIVIGFGRRSSQNGSLDPGSLVMKPTKSR